MMRMPGFTAEQSLIARPQAYQEQVHQSMFTKSRAGEVIPARGLICAICHYLCNGSREVCDFRCAEYCGGLIA
jgi:hypothetical protein